VTFPIAKKVCHFLFPPRTFPSLLVERYKPLASPLTMTD
jgi:hypothetical protein